MSGYRNMFYDKEEDKLVSVDLALEDVIIRPEEEPTESLAEEYDIKDGFRYNNGYNTAPYIGAPLVFELDTGMDTAEDDLAEQIVTDTRISSGYRTVKDAFRVVFDNYIKTCEVVQGGSSHGRTRFRYSLTGGLVTTYVKSSNGLNLSYRLLSRRGDSVGSEGYLDRSGDEGYNLLPNIYSSGGTCHWGLSEVAKWRRDMGKSDGAPETLAKSYELFKAGVGNNDLTSSNLTERMPFSELIDILEEFQRSYVDNISHREMKRNFTSYVREYIREVRRKDPTDTVRLNINHLASILEQTPGFYIEDYI